MSPKKFNTSSQVLCKSVIPDKWKSKWHCIRIGADAESADTIEITCLKIYVKVNPYYRASIIASFRELPRKCVQEFFFIVKDRNPALIWRATNQNPIPNRTRKAYFCTHFWFNHALITLAYIIWIMFLRRWNLLETRLCFSQQTYSVHWANALVVYNYNRP